MSEDEARAELAEALQTLRRVWPTLYWRRVYHRNRYGQLEGFIPPVVDEGGNVRGGLDVLVRVYRNDDGELCQFLGTGGYWVVRDADGVSTQPHQIASYRPKLEDAVANYREVSIAAMKIRMSLYEAGGAHE